MHSTVSEEQITDPTKQVAVRALGLIENTESKMDHPNQALTR